MNSLTATVRKVPVTPRKGLCDLVLIITLVVAVLANEPVAGSQRPFTVADSIEMVRLVDPSASPWAQFKFSPDGNQFLIVTVRGNLKTGLNEYTLAVFDAKDVLDFVNNPERTELPKAVRQIRFETSSPEPAIDQVQWLSDSRRLAFIGRRSDGIGQVYELDLKTGQLRQLTRHADNIERFDLSGDSHVLVYAARTPPDWEERNKHGYAVGSEFITSVITADSRTAAEIRYFIRDLQTYKVTSVDLAPEFRASRVFVAPSGRWAVVQAQVRKIPAQWVDYDLVKELLSGLDYRVGETGHLETEEANPFASLRLRLQQFHLIDLARGAARPLFDAPKETRIDWFGWATLWSPDSKHVMVANTYLPRSVSQLAGFQDCRAIVEVDVKTLQVAPLACAEDARRGNGSQVNRRVIDYRSNDSVLVEENEYRKGAKPARLYQLYRRQDNKWIKSDLPVQPEETEPPELKLSVVQDMNTPPEVEATDPSTGRRRIITKLNPQFENPTLGRVEIFQFSDRLHRQFTAGLIHPPDFQKRRRYPVVIQTYGFLPDLFLVDGMMSTAFAAQAIANRGILVLQVGCSPGEARAEGPFEDVGEYPRAIACAEAAIDALDAQGRIDRGRVGIIGFSRTGQHVLHAVTFSKYPFAAATIADSALPTLWSYVQMYGSFGLGMLEFDTSQHPLVIGAPFWGDGIKVWAERSPAFHLDRIRTPLRCEEIGVGHLPGCWDTFAILKRHGRPIEMIRIPKDEHNLRTPFGRFTSLQGNVDWYAFWLKGEERTHPIPGTPETAESLREQNRRWRVLRRQQEAHLAELRAKGADPASLPTLPPLQSSQRPEVKKP